MGPFDSTEICELVGLYILYKLSIKYGRNHNGFYRDDGLTCFENVSGPKADRIKKDFININIKSNHSPNKIKNLPGSISRRISKLSSNKSVFDNSKDFYNNTISSSSFKDKIKFNPVSNKDISRNKNRKRNIIWFNPHI